MVKFTVITCTYNASKEVERTLESVLSQTYPHVEHLIVDGLSKDDTLLKADVYAQKSREMGSSHEVWIVSERDKGLYDAMNKGIRMAKGDYVIFMNAGDKFHDADTLSDVAKQLEQSFLGGNTDRQLPGVIYGDTDIVDDSGAFLHKRRLSPPERLTWKSFRNGMLVCHQSFYARADIAKRTPYNLEYRFSADVDWCIRVMRDAQGRGLSLHNTHLTLTSYLEGGMSIKNHRASLIERFHVMRRHYGIIITVLKHVSFLFRQ